VTGSLRRAATQGVDASGTSSIHTATGGEFFSFDHRIFFEACCLGLNPAVAFLGVARGAGSRPVSSWSVHAIERYTGMSRGNAQRALAVLIDNGLLKVRGAGSRPQYQIFANQGEDRDLVYLPNSFVDGAADETPPLALLRQMQDIRYLRLFVDLYRNSNLANDGGVSRSVIFKRFQLKKISERGASTIWAFDEQCNSSATNILYGSFTDGANSKREKKAALVDFWTAISSFEACGLLEFVIHLFESEEPEAEMLHPYATGFSGEEWERNVAISAHNAALGLLPPEYENWALENKQHLFLTPSHIAKVAALGVVRLRYRPKTRMTAAWFAMSKERSHVWQSSYEAILARARSRQELSGIDARKIAT
jgi:hypothetical protein